MIISEKIIATAVAWTCENLDLLAPIDWEGYEVLTTSNRRLLVDNVEDAKLEFATSEEISEFLRKLGYLFPGQEVEVVKGRKLPIGEKKIIKDFYDYIVPGTYGHKGTTYIRFSDGTKTSIDNIKPTCELFPNVNYFFQWKFNSPSHLVGGRK